MTEEERNEGLLIFVNTNEAYSVKTKDRVQLGDAARVHFLLSKHFDLFGLIEAGLAIDQTTQPK